MLPAYNTVIFDGTDLNTFGFFSSGSGTYAAPERAVEALEVPGRSGDLVFDNGRFKNLTVTYPGFIGGDMRGRFRSLRTFLLSKAGKYLRLEDTYHPDEFRLAYFKGPINPTIDYLTVATISLEFICKPYRYLKSGETSVEFSSAGSLENPSLLESRPVIKVYGTGVVSIGDWQISVAVHDQEYVEIDSELMDCYCGLTNLNNKVSFNKPGFPVIGSGTVGVTLGEGITQVIIIPRWCML